MSTKKPKKRKYRFVRRTLRVFAGILIFLSLLILFIRSPWGQNIIVDKAANYVSDKTNTKVEIDKAFITFGGSLQVEGLYLEDKNYREISETLGITEVNARVKMNRIKEKLRNINIEKFTIEDAVLLLGGK